MPLTPAEFTAAYNLLISLSSSSPIREQFYARMCQYLSDQPVTSSQQHGSQLAIATLTTLFNVISPDSKARYYVFQSILKVIRASSASQSFDALIPQLEDNVDNWTSAWQLDEEDKQNLYEAIANVAQVSGDRDLTYKYLMKALETIPVSNASDSESQTLAKRTLVEALTNPFVTDFTPLTASDSIQALKSSDAALFELLEIFSSDDFSTYSDFLETNTLSSLGISDEVSEVLTTKIRLLTLATIAASAPNRSVPYSAIASSLRIPSEDVEVWVIDTIRAGLVEGKLSQLKQEFLVQRATYRVFGEKQWAEIAGRLMVWRRSLTQVLEVVRTERERFLREGPGGGYEEQNQQGGRMNGYGDRRQGGRRQQQQREADVGAD
jgi:translation initiation factor 3 subunit M